jgi:hypothetical protein
MTRSSPILAITAGIVVVDLIASGLTLNLGGVRCLLDGYH